MLYALCRSAGPRPPGAGVALKPAPSVCTIAKQVKRPPPHAALLGTSETGSVMPPASPASESSSVSGDTAHPTRVDAARIVVRVLIAGHPKEAAFYDACRR